MPLIQLDVRDKDLYEAIVAKAREDHRSIRSEALALAKKALENNGSERLLSLPEDIANEIKSLAEKEYRTVKGESIVLLKFALNNYNKEEIDNGN